MITTQEDIENQIITIRLIRLYLSDLRKSVWTIEEDACVSARSVSNRYGVPPDAQTRRYVIEHPDQGWSFSARAVWRNGKLMEPVGTHVRIEGYYDDRDELGGSAAARSAANEWLRSLLL
jgi:hypothetical protein